MSQAPAGVLGRLWRGYCDQLARRPVLSRSLTSMAGMGGGDVIAQAACDEAYDPARTSRFAAFGFLAHGTLCHQFYKALDRLVIPNNPKTATAIGAKICIDQFLWSPAFLLVFYGAMKIMEGQPSQWFATIREKYWPTLAVGWTIWIPAHVVNFRFVPLHGRILYINAVNVAWNSVLSTIAYSQKQG